MSPDHPFRTLVVTSAGPAEGKTTIACCVAIAMAQAGQRVALVDCDLRRPRLHRIFNKNPDLGVTSALVGSTEFDKAAFTTDIPNLSVIPSGPIPPNPAELLHSERFKEFLAKLAQEFDRVVIDTPPLVAVTDAVILSTLADGTALVVHAFKTTKELMRQALKVLRDVGAVTAGAILNQVDFDRHEYKTHYYYYKRDGYYSSVPHDAGGAAGGSTGAAHESPASPQ
jgi:capsular exopolysaccharide synthesis family protein